jgi:hypothetical protein
MRASDKRMDVCIPMILTSIFILHRYEKKKRKKKEKEATGILPSIYEQCMSHVVHLINEPADLADKH